MKERVCFMGSIAIIAALFAITILFPSESDYEREKIMRAHKDMMAYYMFRP